MADEVMQDAQVTFKVKTSSDGNHTITMAESATVLDLKTKLSGDDFEKVPTDRMRLIYSGRVMKDPDTLATYKIKSGNTIHMVKSAASNATQKPSAAPTAAGAPSVAAGVPTNMAAGTANNPLAALTGARYAGHMGLPGAEMFGADGGMGAPPGEEDMARMMEDPNMQQVMNEALNNPQMVDMILNSMPGGTEHRAQMRQMFQNPEFRRMMTNPEAMRSAMAMRRAMEGSGGGGFPAPGVTDTTPGGATGSAPTANPFGFNPFMIQPGGFGGAGAGAGAGAAAGNPFASLFGPQAGAGQTPVQTPPGAASAGQGTPSTGADANAANPFASLFAGAGAGAPGGMQLPPGVTVEQVQETMRMLQANGGLGNLFGGANPYGGAPFGAAASPPPPADTRPPEEIYASQLRQLNDMGFFDFDRNIAALRRSGGSVQGAIEQLLR